MKRILITGFDLFVFACAAQAQGTLLTTGLIPQKKYQIMFMNSISMWT